MSLLDRRRAGTATHPSADPDHRSAAPGSPPPSGPAAAALTWWRRDARFDVPASLVVFLVAVPLSLGIAVASGAPVAAGLIAAAVGGIVAGLLGGSPLTVSGPAAGLTVVVAETVDRFGWETTCLITACAGVLQIVLGAGRVGRLALAISPTVVKAMLAGIGVSIVLGQLNVALGSSSQPSAWRNLTSYAGSLEAINLESLVAAVLVIAVLLAWPRVPARLRVVPGPLVAITGVTALAYFLLPGAERVDLGGSVLSQIGLPPLPDGDYLALFGAVLTITLIASVESLLSAVAVDKLHGGPPSRLNRELLGQGAANSASGLLGGLPITGVIVRSATNVASGARTRASAVLHGVWVLVFALALVAVVEQIPLAALAGLLIMMGVGLVKPADMREARRSGELWIYGVTVFLVLALNLVEGVAIGLACALVVVLWRMVQLRAELSHKGDALDGRQHWVVAISGSLSFLATPKLVRVLNSVPPGQVVEVDLLVDYLDLACEEQIELWRRRYTSGGGQVEIEHAGAAAQDPGTKQNPMSSRAIMPWSSWQAPETESPSARLAHGIREYHRRGTEALRPVYAGLADGQAPDSFFVSCVDSRVVPNLLTSSGPGDMVTVRTMGNVVPDAGSADAAVSAPLTYSMEHLAIPTVVLCGHSACPSMQHLLEVDPDDLAAADPGTDPVNAWMSHAREALAVWRGGHPVGRSAAEAGESEADQLSQVNVAVGLDRLRAQVSARDDVLLVGLWLRVEDGTLSMLREDRFVPLTDAELSELAPLL